MARILVVDDEQPILDILRIKLEGQGYEVETRKNGGEALDLLEKGRFDLILMDYFMPMLKGDTVCKQIREDERFQSLPIIIMTGFTHYDEDYFFDIGATDVIYKPVETGDLFEKIEKHLPK